MVLVWSVYLSILSFYNQDLGKTFRDSHSELTHSWVQCFLMPSSLRHDGTQSISNLGRMGNPSCRVSLPSVLAYSWKGVSGHQKWLRLLTPAAQGITTPVSQLHVRPGTQGCQAVWALPGFQWNWTGGHLMVSLFIFWLLPPDCPVSSYLHP